MARLFWRIVLALSLVVVAAPTHAAIVEQQGATIRLSGAIVSTTSDLFTNAFARAILVAEVDEAVTVVLDSEGGSTAAAHRIADVIHVARGFGTAVNTRVDAGGQCMSACPLVFSAGEARVASAEAMFLFHGVTYRGKRSTAEVAAALAVEKQRYLDRMRAADSRLAAFLSSGRVIEDGIDTAFDGAALHRSFPGFVTTLADVD